MNRLVSVRDTTDRVVDIARYIDSAPVRELFEDLSRLHGLVCQISRTKARLRSPSTVWHLDRALTYLGLAVLRAPDRRNRDVKVKVRCLTCIRYWIIKKAKRSLYRISEGSSNHHHWNFHLGHEIRRLTKRCCRSMSPWPPGGLVVGLELWMSVNSPAEADVLVERRELWEEENQKSEPTWSDYFTLTTATDLSKEADFLSGISSQLSEDFLMQLEVRAEELPSDGAQEQSMVCSSH
jgi:hypothetical protein